MPSLKILSKLASNLVGQNVILYTDYYTTVISKINSKINFKGIFKYIFENISNMDYEFSNIILDFIKLGSVIIIASERIKDIHIIQIIFDRW